MAQLDSASPYEGEGCGFESRHGYMSSNKDPEARRAYQREWYAKNKERTIKRNLERHAANRRRNFDFIDELRDNTPCTDCGVQYPHYVMDFDHVRSEKIGDVSKMASDGWSLENIKAEIEKCEIVCSNCHRVRTWERREQSRVV